MKTRSVPLRHKCSCNDEFYAGILLELKDMVCRDAFKTAWRSGVVWGAKKKKRSTRARRMMIRAGFSEEPPKPERRQKKGGGGGGGGGGVLKKKKRKSPDTPLDCIPVPKVPRIKFVRSQTRPESASASASGHERVPIFDEKVPIFDEKVPIFDEKVPIFDDGRSPAAATKEEEAASGLTTTTALIGCSTWSTGCLVEEEACADSCLEFEIPDLNIPVVLEDGLLETETNWS